MVYDCVVVGAGPSGMSASIYLARANLKCLVIEKDAPGGQMLKASLVENYPGINNITGPELAMNFYKQAKEAGVSFRFGEVLDIDVNETPKKVILNDEVIYAKSIILALGRSPKTLGIEKDLVSKGVSYCALCDGTLYKNKDVIVVGGGNSALGEAIYLSSICKSVTIINRSSVLKASQILVDKALNIKNINILYNSKVTKFNEKEGILDSVLVDDNGSIKNLNVSACFIYIGYEPSTLFLKRLDILDEKGYIIVDQKFRTKYNLVYACGDVIAKDAYQIATSTGDGVSCAIDVINILNKG